MYVKAMQRWVRSRIRSHKIWRRTGSGFGVNFSDSAQL